MATGQPFNRCSMSTQPGFDFPQPLSERFARRLLKHAEIHVLQDVQFWTSDPPAWSEAQTILRTLRFSLSQRVQVSSTREGVSDGPDSSYVTQQVESM